jgi:hypothetical protein
VALRIVEGPGPFGAPGADGVGGFRVDGAVLGDGAGGVRVEGAELSAEVRAAGAAGVAGAGAAGVRAAGADGVATDGRLAGAEGAGPGRAEVVSVRPGTPGRGAPGARVVALGTAGALLLGAGATGAGR